MELRAEQYRQIVAQLRSERAARRGRTGERRGAPRVGLRATVRVIPCRTGTAARVEPAWVRDISAEGIGLIFHEAVAPGTYVVVSLPAGEAMPPLDILFLVVRCTDLGGGQFSLGARFQRFIEPEDVG